MSEQTLPLNRILNPKRRQHYCKQGDQCRGLGFGPVDKWGLGFAPVIPVINVSEQTLSKVINMLEKPLNPTCRPPKVRGLLNLIVAGATKSETYKPNCTITPWTQETFRAGAGLELTHRLSESYKHDATVQV